MAMHCRLVHFLEQVHYFHLASPVCFSCCIAVKEPSSHAPKVKDSEYGVEAIHNASNRTPVYSSNDHDHRGRVRRPQSP
jgi:hypothetical protein